MVRAPLASAASVLDWRRLRASPARCPLCGPTLLVQLSASAIGVRCARCRASAITMAVVAVLKDEIPALDGLCVYELSSRGPLVEWLRREGGQLTVSEWFEGVAPGEIVGGVMCQDVQRLTFGPATFDVCTSTEVFEHVPDDASAFAEVRRVLRPGGRLVFSVPIADAAATVERAVIEDGAVRHLAPPEYHGDRRRGPRGVLAFRTYGRDIVDRVGAAGFHHVRIARPPRAFRGFTPPVVVATA
jgi:SAM-dependent methyltransferase